MCIRDSGYTDTVASVSINLYGFVNGVKDCLRQASSETTAKSSWNDGSFSYEAPEFDSNGSVSYTHLDVYKRQVFDLMLPGMDGLSAIKRIRKNDALADMPIIILTAKDREFDKVAGLDGGADDYMTKPFGVKMCIRDRCDQHGFCHYERGVCQYAGECVFLQEYGQQCEQYLCICRCTA